MRLRRVFCLLPLLLTCGCSPQRSLVVLLPEADGHVGRIEVTNASGVRVIADAYHGAPLDGAAPETGAVDPVDVERRFGPALAAQPGSRFRIMSLQVYCRWDSSELVDESRVQMPALAKSIRRLNPAEIFLVGHTDRVGSGSYNLELSRRRASAVKALLSAAGVRCPMVVVASGMANPLVEEAGPDAQPFNRRVEIVVKYPREEVTRTSGGPLAQEPQKAIAR
jgi:outer membrane protein OmpA-like peptidoglycan-associated protein